MYFPSCQKLSQQNRGGLIFLSLHGSLDTSCCWKDSSTGRLSIISEIHQPALRMVFPLQKPHRKLASGYSEWRKTKFNTLRMWDFGKSRVTARLLIIEWLKRAPQKHRWSSTTSLLNVAQVSAKLKLPVHISTEIKSSINSSPKQVWSSASPHSFLKSLSTINKHKQWIDIKQ